MDAFSNWGWATMITGLYASREKKVCIGLSILTAKGEMEARKSPQPGKRSR